MTKKKHITVELEPGEDEHRAFIRVLNSEEELPTRKKKRMPKPLPNSATRFLLENCLDFLNLDFEELSCKLAVGEKMKDLAEAILPAVAKPLSVIMNLPYSQVVRSMKGCGWEEKFPLQHLVTTLSGARAMIRQALMKDGGQTCVFFSANHYEKFEDFERPVNNISILAWMNEAMSGLKFSSAWHGWGH